MTSVESSSTATQIPNIFQQVLQDFIGLLGRFIKQSNRDLITVLRQPTPIKIVRSLQADASGTIGGGLANPTPVDVWMCPVSHEAWINRITITSPSGQPKTPLTTGQVMCTAGSGEPIFFLPIAGNVAPLQITEGRLSAPHLNPGSRLVLSADSLPANCNLRIDLQIVLVTGISPDAPTNYNIDDAEVLD